MSPLPHNIIGFLFLCTVVNAYLCRTLSVLTSSSLRTVFKMKCLALRFLSCVIFSALVQSSDIIPESTLRSSILSDIQASNASCFPKDTCRTDKVSSIIFIYFEMCIFFWYLLGLVYTIFFTQVGAFPHLLINQ